MSKQDNPWESHKNPFKKIGDGGKKLGTVE